MRYRDLVLYLYSGGTGRRSWNQSSVLWYTCMVGDTCMVSEYNPGVNLYGGGTGRCSVPLSPYTVVRLVSNGHCRSLLLTTEVSRKEPGHINMCV